MRLFILGVASLFFLFGCSEASNKHETKNQNMEKENLSAETMPDNSAGMPGKNAGMPGKNAVVTALPDNEDVITAFSLTVSESKRLIAKGIAKHPRVQQKMKSGMIIITLGSTNTYIAEELAGLSAVHGTFMIGHIAPQPVKVEGKRIPEIILMDGKPVEMTFKEALEALKEGDLIFKGGNLLNYEKKQAAVTVGAPDGGTTARIQPYTAEGPAHLIVPIGLEKEVAGDLYEYEKILSLETKQNGFVPRIVVHKNAEIFTEIEALKQFGNVEVVPYASGGIAGSEGSKSFAVYGAPSEVDRVLHIIKEIQGEPAFVK